MNFCACWGVNALLLDAIVESAVAYLDVLDGNTTHFVGIDGDCRGRLRDVVVLSVAASKVAPRRSNFDSWLACASAAWRARTVPHPHPLYSTSRIPISDVISSSYIDLYWTLYMTFRVLPWPMLTSTLFFLQRLHSSHVHSLPASATLVSPSLHRL